MMMLIEATATTKALPSPGGGGSVRNRAKRDKDRGGVAVSPRPDVCERRDHPTPSRIAPRCLPTLPLQGRVAAWLASERAADHLFENLPADALVGERRRMP